MGIWTCVLSKREHYKSNNILFWIMHTPFYYTSHIFSLGKAQLDLLSNSCQLSHIKSSLGVFHTSFERTIQQNKWTWNSTHLELFRTHPGFIPTYWKIKQLANLEMPANIHSPFCPIWQIFWPMYHKPSKSAGCLIFQYVKNKAQTGLKWPQASGTSGSFILLRVLSNELCHSNFE